MKKIIYIILLVIVYYYGKAWNQAETERKAVQYIDSGKCTEEQQKALEIVIFKEVQE